MAAMTNMTALAAMAALAAFLGQSSKEGQFWGSFKASILYPTVRQAIFLSRWRSRARDARVASEDGDDPRRTASAAVALARCLSGTQFSDLHYRNSKCDQAWWKVPPRLRMLFLPDIFFQINRCSTKHTNYKSIRTGARCSA